MIIMDKQRILKEAQRIAKDFSFWMVSGDINHLYGYAYEFGATKYELEIKFDENFPSIPPQIIYHNEIKELLGSFQLNTLVNWTPNSEVVNIIHELKAKIEDKVNSKNDLVEKNLNSIDEQESAEDYIEKEEYITPDLSIYPPDFQFEEFNSSIDSPDDLFYNEDFHSEKTKDSGDLYIEDSGKKSIIDDQESYIQENEQISLATATELGLIQQEYAYDQLNTKEAMINVYITITLTKTFIISINFITYPEKPKITYPDEVKNILGEPDLSLESLKNWNPKKPIHIVNILHELENKLNFIKDIELQSKQIMGEYRCEKVPGRLTTLNVHLLTYGFKEYTMTIDLDSYPKPPKINLSSELQNMISIPITELNSYKNWENNISESVEIIREISWLVDKNSRINFEIDLLKDHYKNIKYEPSTTTLNLEMKGKMKTEDLTFDFQIELPVDYPMKMPEIKVVNEFELEAHEKIKNDLHASFNDFFKEWTPFSYLVDLFNLISKKIFEVSVVACVICHKIECPSCSKKIAGEDNCHAECPHCNRAYHYHCWEQTIKSFGKCGFCLR